MPAKLHSPLKQQEFYCVATNKRVSAKKDDICIVRLRNGQYARYATCPKTGVDMYKFIKDSQIDRLINKYGEC